MVFLRVVTYGPSYEFMARHICQDAKDHSYIIDIDGMIGAMPLLDPTTVEAVYNLQLNTQSVKLRPNKYQQVIDLIKENENKKEITVGDQRRNLVIMLLGVIESVSGISDPKLIAEWIEHLTMPQVNRIAEKIELINNWGPEMQTKCLCKDCGTEFPVDIPINPISFFTE